MSRKSVAVGTGDIAFKPLVDMVATDEVLSRMLPVVSEFTDPAYGIPTSGYSHVYVNGTRYNIVIGQVIDYAR